MAVLTVLAACSGSTDQPPVAEAEQSALPPPLLSTTTSEFAPAPPLAAALAGRVDSTDKGSVVAVSFRDDSATRGACWNVAVWDGAAFVVTYVTGSRETAEEASEFGVTRLTDLTGLYGCPAIGLSGVGPDFIFIPSVVGAGTFRICQDRRCFQFDTDPVGVASLAADGALSPVVPIGALAPALEGGLSPLVESSEDGTLVAMWFEPPMEIADCWTVSVWDGGQFVETFVTTMEQTVKDAKEADVSRLDVPGSTLSCPDTARIQQLTFMFMDADVIGSGTFRVCQDDNCFQFAR